MNIKDWKKIDRQFQFSFWFLICAIGVMAWVFSSHLEFQYLPLLFQTLALAFFGKYRWDKIIARV